MSALLSLIQTIHEQNSEDFSIFYEYDCQNIFYVEAWPYGWKRAACKPAIDQYINLDDPDADTQLKILGCRIKTIKANKLEERAKKELEPCDICGHHSHLIEGACQPCNDLHNVSLANG